MRLSLLFALPGLELDAKVPYEEELPTELLAVCLFLRGGMGIALEEEAGDLEEEDDDMVTPYVLCE